MPSGLRQRIVTGLLLAATLLAVLFLLPRSWAVAAVMLAVAVGAWEWAGLAGLATRGRRAAYALALMLAVAAAWRLTATPEALRTFLFMAVVWWVAALAWIVMAPGRGGAMSAAGAGVLVLVPAAVAIGRLVSIEPGGPVLLLVLVVLIAAADIGAYFGGRRYGRRRLAPAVSPGKTWEGFLAGLVTALLAAAAIFSTVQPAGVALPAWLAVCAFVALVSVVGDLVESMFKRRVGLKDSSALLPGHGGVLDRVDSLTAAGPAFLLGLKILGVVP